MRITRKRGKGIRIEHNKTLFWIIILLLILFAILIYFIVNNKTDTEASECKVNEDCVPATCCHPDSCVPAEKAPECKNIMCSMVCSGPLDCGAGICGCVNNKCEIIPSK